MRLDLDAVSNAGGFSGAPVKREIEWKDMVFDVYVRRLSYHSAVSDVRTIASNGDIAASRIAACIVDEHGKPIFTVSDITGINEDGSPVMVKNEKGKMVERGSLDAELAMALMTVISEVNGLGKTRNQN